MADPASYPMVDPASYPMADPASYPMGTGGPSVGVKRGRDVKLTTATALSSQPMLRLLISAVLGSTTVGGIRL
jgi:hypothetical protein